MNTGKTESRTGRREKRVVSFSESDSEADEPSSSSRGKVGDGVFLKSIVESSENEELESEIRVEIHSGDQVNGVNNQTDESESGGIEMTKMMMVMIVTMTMMKTIMVRVVTTMKMMAGIGMETPFSRHTAIYPPLHGHLHINKHGWWVHRGETGNQTAPVTDGDDKTPENGSSLGNTHQESTGSPSDEPRD